MKKEKLKLNFKYWDHTCGDGCCYSSGIDLYINDKHVTDNSDCPESIIETLKFLGYDLEVHREYDD